MTHIPAFSPQFDAFSREVSGPLAHSFCCLRFGFVDSDVMFWVSWFTYDLKV